MADRAFTARKVARLLADHPHPGRVTTRRIMELTGFVDGTARRALRDLRRAGVLVERDELHLENLSRLDDNPVE